jgi:hypothetical protein
MVKCLLENIECFLPNNIHFPLKGLIIILSKKNPLPPYFCFPSRFSIRFCTAFASAPASVSCFSNYQLSLCFHPAYASAMLMLPLSLQYSPTNRVQTSIK